MPRWVWDLAGHRTLVRARLAYVLAHALDYGLQRLPGEHVPAHLAEIGCRERVSVRVEQHANAVLA